VCVEGVIGLPFLCGSVCVSFLWSVVTEECEGLEVFRDKGVILFKIIFGFFVVFCYFVHLLWGCIFFLLLVVYCSS
jgi:hypothetical protein